MKLIKDFGVKALVTVMSGVGFYWVLLYVLANFELPTTTVVALVGLANAPWLACLGIYTGFRMGEKMSKNNKGGTS